MRRVVTVLCFGCLLALVPREASALITGGVGNSPITDPGWPSGTAPLFNHAGRVAWWEGPPFGGGQWHSECRGDVKALNALLSSFARLDVATRRVVVHDGPGYSFWLAPNREPAKLAAARIDWTLTVWQAASWNRLHRLPADLNPTDPAATGPPAQVDVFTEAIRWADVTVPPGVEVLDERLTAHGFTAADGYVLEGKVTDLATGQPLAASVELQRVEPRKTGGYDYPVAVSTRCDAQGHWVLKHVAPAWVRVAVTAEGYAPRVAGYSQPDEAPRWEAHDTGLTRAATVSGRVTDAAGQPLAGVSVRFDDVAASVGGRYESPTETEVKTDEAGRFRSRPLPAGSASIWVHKPGYCRPGLGLKITTPADDVALTMSRSAQIRATVDFAGKPRPAGYIVELTPEGGNVVGSFGGSGQINDQNQMVFENVPPGRYTLHGKPNPMTGDERSEPVTVDLKGGDTAEVKLRAK